ncbi:hypothetical protein [Treponema phagedenis]|uniref:hypothetical protein n=1 Tax=Treponema phagedenis TaxID=162 RepID=UPI001583F1B7|nr:hypothetical protein [Treponema phagedenis]QKS91937.1 hypothetical protein HPJ96_04755 [Treponema phagedenis]
MDGNRTKYVRQFVSYNEEDAKEKIQYAQEFYASIHPKAKKKLRSCTKTAMEFYDKSGKTVSRLISIACRPPRGRGGDIVFDEMAIYPENKAEVIYTAGIPVTARGGCVEIGSTPLGKIGRFYDVFSTRKNTEPITATLFPGGFLQHSVQTLKRRCATLPQWIQKSGCIAMERLLLLKPSRQCF